MKELQAKLVNIEDVKNFVEVNSRKDYDIDVVVGRYTIDAKSIMGVFHLNLKNPIKVVLHTDNEQEIINYEREIANILV